MIEVPSYVAMIVGDVIACANEWRKVNDVVDGLTFMHSLDVVHGDLKPASSSFSVLFR
jgi:hypothetical protein